MSSASRIIRLISPNGVVGPPSRMARADAVYWIRQNEKARSERRAGGDRGRVAVATKAAAELRKRHSSRRQQNGGDDTGLNAVSS